MSENIMKRLFSSFVELERAIEGAKTTLASKPTVPPQILERLQSYDSVLEKQRNLAITLCDHMNKGNWDEVSRHVSLINGLSAMIRDDARAILTSISLNSDRPGQEEEVNFC